MQSLVTAAILTLALWSNAALAQVYGGEDDPYQQSPFASNSYVPPPQETPLPASVAPATVAPATPAATTPTDAGKTQQAAASGSDQDAKTNAAVTGK